MIHNINESKVNCSDIMIIKENIVSNVLLSDNKAKRNFFHLFDSWMGKSRLDRKT